MAFEPSDFTRERPHFGWAAPPPPFLLTPHYPGGDGIGLDCHLPPVTNSQSLHLHAVCCVRGCRRLAHLRPRHLPPIHDGHPLLLRAHASYASRPFGPQPIHLHEILACLLACLPAHIQQCTNTYGWSWWAPSPRSPSAGAPVSEPLSEWPAGPTGPQQPGCVHTCTGAVSAPNVRRCGIHCPGIGCTGREMLAMLATVYTVGSCSDEWVCVACVAMQQL